MSTKRKRDATCSSKTHTKRVKSTAARSKIGIPTATQLLQSYYPFVTSLRSFVLGKLGSKSGRLRERWKTSTQADSVSVLLDTVLVGCQHDPASTYSGHQHLDQERALRTKDFFNFTQRLDSSATPNRRIIDGTMAASTLGEGGVSMADLVDFAIWRLFSRMFRLLPRPPHVLCHGYQRSDIPKNTAEDRASMGDIEGLRKLYPNSQVERLKDSDWAKLLADLGLEGDYIMLELLLDCGVFMPLSTAFNTDSHAVAAETGNYWQISGISLADLPPRSENNVSMRRLVGIDNASRARPKPTAKVKSPSAVTFVRNRMFYARATLNGKGTVGFGLKHIHVLNRYKQPENAAHTKHILKYIFPRQFRLHNVFTSSVDRKETAQPFKDYTLREHEISAWSQERGVNAANKTPKRLRGECLQLVQKLQRQHRSCAYKKLLLHYCPVQVLDGPTAASGPARKKRKRTSDNVFPTSTASMTQARLLLAGVEGRDKHLIELSTPIEAVSAFARSVIWKVIPRAFLGKGPVGQANFRRLLTSVHHFIICTRFENLTLEAVCRNIQVSAIPWMQPFSTGPDVSMSLSDFSKRSDLLHELLYYIFDSFLIPLIRANFYVTESNDHKYKLFYFRHDVWRLVTQPALSRMKMNMFQELPTTQAQALLDSRILGYSQVRLMPKRDAVRPITNLRRRVMVRRGGRSYLGASINSSLKNVFSMLNYEKDCQVKLLQSAIFSVTELYPRLVSLRQRLHRQGLSEQPLYFVKVDVQSCFDTIPQAAVIELIERLCNNSRYVVKHHTEVKTLPSARQPSGSITKHKPAKKFVASAHPASASHQRTFAEILEDKLMLSKRNTVFTEGAVQTHIETEGMLDLLDDHVRRNIVRIGKKFYRQENGIPQGSILSTLLCSFFYGDFERQKLDFLHKQRDVSTESMLVRLIDDFLLITTEKQHAERFLGVMLEGDKEYGITVRPEKTLVNFQSSFNVPVMRKDKMQEFPWCKILIGTRSLGVTRDREGTTPYLPMLLQPGRGLASIRGEAADLADSTTLEVNRRAGAAFNRKVLATLRLNLRNMYLDTTSKPIGKIKSEVMISLLEVAERAGRYLARVHDRGSAYRLRDEQVQRTIMDVANAANTLIRRSRLRASTQSIAKPQLDWMVCKAFEAVLGRQQTRHPTVVKWLKKRADKAELGGYFKQQLMRSLSTRACSTST